MKKKCFAYLLFCLFAFSCAKPDASSSLTDSSTPSYLDSYKSSADKAIYDFDPLSVKYPEYCVEEGSTLRAMNLEEIEEKSKTAPSYDDKTLNIVAQFEGTYAEGYNGVYSVKQCKIRLFENGTFSTSSESNINITNGCWFSDVSYEQNGKEVLGFKLGYIKDKELSTIECLPYEKLDNCYICTVPFKLSYDMTRTMTLLGYIYYPTVGIYIDSCGYDEFTISEGESTEYVIDMIRNRWQGYLVLKNLTIFPIDEYELPIGRETISNLIEYSISDCDKEGKKTVVARYDKFYFTRDINLYIE